jgi:hypothetical protein
LKGTSVTGHIRFSENPNRRVQDGWKPRLLCSACEQRFGRWEKEFAERVFAPLNALGEEDQVALSYGPWMGKFAVSISWRVLTAYKLIGGLDEFPSAMVTAAGRAQRWWQDFLLDRRPNPGPFEQHMLPVNVIAETTIPSLPPNINRYLSRAVDLYVAYNRTSCIVYAKMGKIVLFGFVAMPHARKWKGTKLRVKNGTFGSDQYELYDMALELMMDQARKMSKAWDSISERQEGKIRTSFEENRDRVAGSEMFHAMQHDVALFGRSAFSDSEGGGDERVRPRLFSLSYHPHPPCSRRPPLARPRRLLTGMGTAGGVGAG